ncbi:AAA family ATPase [Sedimentimonas flavescens]|uniref:AAA family ATPase n=1 Tax=Sedimentimonas flavescens TaxID=2851012 RepID=UPI001C4A481A|nr:AAA family ATPase [Sedimentimonas flavescens]MBW0157616.1 AAA family ATPase [Sedimentimonas flavescens]
MKLRSLTLVNVRKFGGKSVSIEGFGDGVSVISEANEFGKSTFFDALHALFFEKYSTTVKSVKSLRPHAGGGVKVAAQVEIGGARFDVEKRFLARAGASVTETATGRVIARDDEAEAWVAGHLSDANRGPAGLLWVRQGVLGLEPADSKPADREKLAEVRRDLLSSVAGEIDQVTGGRTMDRILRRCEEDLGVFASVKTLSPRGPWKEARDLEADLSAELSDLDQKVSELRDALEARRKIDDELARLTDPAETDRRRCDLDAATQNLQTAEAHSRTCEVAESALSMARLVLREATRRSDTRREAVEQARIAEAKVQKTQETLDLSKAAREAAQASEGEARNALDKLVAATLDLRDELRLAERQAAAHEAENNLERLMRVHGEAQKHLQAMSEARARLSDNRVTPELADTVDAAQRLTDRLTAQIAARRVSVTIDYVGARRVTKDGGEVPDGVPVALANADVLMVPGIGTLRFALPDAGTDDLSAQLADAERTLAGRLADCAVSAVAQVHERLAERRRDEAVIDLALNSLKVLAPDGTEVLDIAIAKARGKIADAPEGDVREAEEVSTEFEAAIEAEQAGRQAWEQARERVTEARIEAEGAEAKMQAAWDEAKRTKAALDRLEDEAELESNLAEARLDEEAKSAALNDLTQDAPDLETAQANLHRAKTAFDNARSRLSTLREGRATLTGQINTHADGGIEERRAEVAELLEEATKRAARYAFEVAALVRLRDDLQAARDQAREFYFKPIQTELAPLLRILHDDAQIEWESDQILPGALQRGGDVEDFETLSGGTQEQIAILTRLAFARLLARRGEHVPIILDDALVYSDDDRIVKMFTALNRVAANQQIIVFSCRQLAFAGLGGERPRISEVSMA